MGTWTTLANKPNVNIGTMLLLMDGTVFCADSGSPRPRMPPAERQGVVHWGTGRWCWR